MTRDLKCTALAVMAMLTLLGCSEPPNSAEVPQERTLVLSGTVKVHAWSCTGSTAKSTSDLMSRLLESSDSRLSTTDATAAGNAIMELGDAQLYGTPLPDRSSDQLGLTPEDSLDPDDEVSEPCPGLSDEQGLGDLRDGAPVTISNADGKVIAATKLTDGHTTIRGTSWNFEATIPPRSIYEVTLGNRGSVTVSNSDLKQNAYTINLQVGP